MSHNYIPPRSQLIPLFITAALCCGLINFLYLVLRAGERGVRQEPIIRAISYLVLVCVDRFGEEGVANLIATVWDSIEGRPYPPELQKYILEPVFGNLQSELKDVCSRDCRRIITDLEILQEEEASSYWQRLILTEAGSENPKRILTVESTKEPCKVGFSLDKDVGCPLCNIKNPHEDLIAFVRVVNKVISYRRNSASASN